MNYSYTQISQYLTCPRRYRHRYLDGWQEKDTRAAMLFGRAFEQALAAYFRQEDPGLALYQEWGAYQNQPLHYGQRDSWDRMLHQGIQLLERLLPGRSGQSCPASPQSADQVHAARSQDRMTLSPMLTLSGDSMATAACSSGKPVPAATRNSQKGCLALDPQLICYSWITGIPEVAQIVFVRKRLVEIQYLRTAITDEQRVEFGHLVSNHDPTNRSGAVSAAQRHSLSPESVQYLSLYRALPGQTAAGGCCPHSSTRSAGPWCV